jgi:hypothetical protein
MYIKSWRRSPEKSAQNNLMTRSLGQIKKDRGNEEIDREVRFQAAIAHASFPSHVFALPEPIRLCKASLNPVFYSIKLNYLKMQ